MSFNLPFLLFEYVLHYCEVEEKEVCDVKYTK